MQNAIRYELTILTAPDKHEQAMKEIVDMFTECYDGAEIVKFDNEGTKRLAYSIDEYEYATYTYLVVDLAPNKCPLWCITQDLDRMEGVLRYLAVPPRKLR